jgi:hypothetical protein
MISQESRIEGNRGIWQGVFKGIEDRRKLPALWTATPEIAIRPFQFQFHLQGVEG